jgi:hypothetical protein
MNTNHSTMNPDQRTARKAMVTHWVEAGLFLRQTLGDYAAGMVLLEVFFTDDPLVTAEYVCARLGGVVSEDTVRRRLKRMVDQGTVVVKPVGRVKLYSINPACAEAAAAFMERKVTTHPDLSEEAQNAR